MNAPLNENIIMTSAVSASIEAACNSIAPTWPLDRMIAVNPYWGRIQQPFNEAAFEMMTIAGSPLAMPFNYYRALWESREINEHHLEKAIRELRVRMSVQDLLDLIAQPSTELGSAPLLSDLLDRRRDLIHEPAWCDTITHQVSQFCAAYFDRNQADWHPDQQNELYASWVGVMRRDHSVALLMRAAGIRAKAGALMHAPNELIAYALTHLEIPEGQWVNYLQAVILRISGWASWCAYRRWQARLSSHDDQTLRDLLAIRLAWECLVDDGMRDSQSVWQAWRDAWDGHFQSTVDVQLQSRLIWQRAQEIAYQQKLGLQLLKAPRLLASEPKVQAVFCIDVRSEILRRHFEEQSPDIQTRGFAGFFGLPISYTPLGTQATWPQLPGLLAPMVDVTDSSGEQDQDQQLVSRRVYRLRDAFGLLTFQSMPVSAFALVESLGLGYASQLIKYSMPGATGNASSNNLGFKDGEMFKLRPVIRDELIGGVEGKTNLAVRVLSSMQLTSNFAPLVLFIGHGSQSKNNPQRAGLDCGACCGQSGEINARVLASILNDQVVRQNLIERGITIPNTTHFLAGLHNTTTDEVQLFDEHELLDVHAEAIKEIHEQLQTASQASRKERAASLGLQALAEQPSKLLRALKKRAHDWAETRPEWGLLNNATFIIAARNRTRGINFEGRSFLHDYDYREDPDGILLEQIMTAPMLVANWINMQYFASTVDHNRYGSGNKTLHNVVAGRLGVFEGNGGDLRIGLSKQSVHDGIAWRHAPLRLTVVIEAPRESIERVISEHVTVRNLVCNKWLYLMRLGDKQIEIFQENGWQLFAD